MLEKKPPKKDKIMLGFFKPCIWNGKRKEEVHGSCY